MLLANAVYDATATFPNDEKFGLSSQLKRAVVSIPSNIAEGAERQGTKEFIQFLSIARGSLAEVETQIILAHQRSFVSIHQRDELLVLCEEVSRMLIAMKKSLAKKLTTNHLSLATPS